MNLTRIYRLLVGLYPRDQAERFGREMQAVFRQAAEEHRGRGAAAYVRFAIQEFWGGWGASLLPGSGGLRAARQPIA